MDKITKNLRIERSPKEGGTFVTTDSLHEAVQEVAKHCKVTKGYRGNTGEWEGRAFGSWDEISKAFLEPWKDGLEKVNNMLDAIRNSGIEPPESVRRRNKWNEMSGEINIDRILMGEPEYMRQGVRRNSSAPRNVAILCNVGNLGGYTADQIFWRGAAAIAAIDLLEEAGYQCEVWCWNHALNCFGYSSSYSPYSRKKKYGSRGAYSEESKEKLNEMHPQGGDSFFFCAKLKECGDPVDLDRLTNGLSAWFFRTVIFGMRDVVKDGAFGSGGSQHVIGKWLPKMDVSEGMTKVNVPSVFTEKEAVEAAKQILEDVKNRKDFESNSEEE